MNGNFLNLSVPNPVKEWAFNKKFAPFSDNAYRLLGVVASASQSEISQAFESSRKRLKLGAIKTKPTDLEWLGKCQRDENSVRESFGRLNNPSLRLRERLFWFHQEINTARISCPNDLEREVKKILNSGGTFANHSAALFSLAVLHSFDSYFNQPIHWFETMHLWYQVAGDDAFWTYLAKLDLQGDFEQTIYPAEIEEFRGRLIEIILEDCAVLIRKILLDNRINQALIGYDSIRQTLQTDSHIEYFENAALAEFEQKYDEICEEEFEGAWLKPYSVRNRVLPFLKALILLAGSQSRLTNRLLTVSSAHLLDFVKRYSPETQLEIDIHREFCRAAWILAPPDSYIFDEVAEYAQEEELDLQIPQTDSAETHYRMVVDDLQATSASFIPNIGTPPQQQQVYQEPETSSGEGLKSLAWVVGILLFMASCCLRGGLNSTSKSPKYPTPPIPKFTPYTPNFNISIPPPPLKIEPIKSSRKKENRKK